MGFFRKHKAKQYTDKQARSNMATARMKIRQLCAEQSCSNDALDQALIEWAEWRELLARKEDQNESDVR